MDALDVSLVPAMLPQMLRSLGLLGRECREITLHSDKYGQSITILHFGTAVRWSQVEEEEEVEDALDRFSGRAWDIGSSQRRPQRAAIGK
jgi:hypothetical protein